MLETVGNCKSFWKELMAYSSSTWDKEIKLSLVVDAMVVVEGLLLKVVVE